MERFFTKRVRLEYTEENPPPSSQPDSVNSDLQILVDTKNTGYPKHEITVKLY